MQSSHHSNCATSQQGYEPKALKPRPERKCSQLELAAIAAADADLTILDRKAWSDDEKTEYMQRMQMKMSEQMAQMVQQQQMAVQQQQATEAALANALAAKNAAEQKLLEAAAAQPTGSGAAPAASPAPQPSEQYGSATWTTCTCAE